MKTMVRYRDGSSVVVARGLLTIGDGMLAIGAAMDRAMSADNERILIDLTRVSSLDSAGVSVLVQSALRARDAGVPLGLVTGAGKVGRVLETLNLQACLPMFEDLGSAFDGLGSNETSRETTDCPGG